MAQNGDHQLVQVEERDNLVPRRKNYVFFRDLKTRANKRSDYNIVKIPRDCSQHVFGVDTINDQSFNPT
ncbi:hypothetical protein TKK_0004708 [Trichogramma kaykai]